MCGAGKCQQDAEPESAPWADPAGRERSLRRPPHPDPAIAVPLKVLIQRGGTTGHQERPQQSLKEKQ